LWKNADFKFSTFAKLNNFLEHFTNDETLGESIKVLEGCGFSKEESIEKFYNYFEENFPHDNSAPSFRELYYEKNTFFLLEKYFPKAFYTKNIFEWCLEFKIFNNSEIYKFSASWKNADFDLTTFVKEYNLDDLLCNDSNWAKVISMLEIYGNSKEESIRKLYKYFEKEYPDKPSPICIPKNYVESHIHEILNEECLNTYIITEIYKWGSNYKTFQDYHICDFYILWKKSDFNLTIFLEKFSIDDLLYDDDESGKLIRMFEQLGFSKEESSKKLYKYFEILYPGNPSPLCIPKYYENSDFYGIFSLEFPNAKYTREIFEWCKNYEIFNNNQICDFFILWKLADFDPNKFLNEYNVEDLLYNNWGGVISMLEKFGYSKEISIKKIYETYEELYPDKPTPTGIPKYYDYKEEFRILEKAFPNARNSKEFYNWFWEFKLDDSYNSFKFFEMWKIADFKFSTFVKQNKIEDKIVNHNTFGRVIRTLEKSGFSKDDSIKKFYDYFEENYPKENSPPRIPSDISDWNVFHLFEKYFPNARYTKGIYDLCENLI